MVGFQVGRQRAFCSTTLRRGTVPQQGFRGGSHNTTRWAIITNQTPFSFIGTRHAYQFVMHDEFIHG